MCGPGSNVPRCLNYAPQDASPSRWSNRHRCGIHLFPHFPRHKRNTPLTYRPTVAGTKAMAIAPGMAAVRSACIST